MAFNFLGGLGNLWREGGAHYPDEIGAYNAAVANIFGSANQAQASVYNTDIGRDVSNAQLAEAAARRQMENSQFGQTLGAKQNQFQLFQQLLGVSPNGGGAPSGGSPSGGTQFSSFLTNSPFYQQNLADVQNMGAGQLSRIDQDFTNAGNSAVGNLNARGLGASNLVGGALNSTADRKSQALADLNDQMLGRRIAVRDSEAERINQLRGQLLGQLGGINF